MEEIRQFLKDGLSITEISKLTGFDRKTVRKYLTGPEVPRYGPRQPRPSKLDPYKPYIEERLTAGVWNAQMLLRELRGRGYDGGCTLIKDYLQPKRDAARLVAVRRFETPPGKQAQVDWGHLGDLLDGERPQRIWGFVFTLGHSRALFADVALNQRLDTFLRLHEEAFRELGGIPEEILYDRVKTVWVGTDERGEVRWHPVFNDFADYWGFRPRLCRAYRAQTKGKVESGIRYLRSSFLPGLEVDALVGLRIDLQRWVGRVANERVHGTTHQVVREAWEREKHYLQPPGQRPSFPYVPQETRRVTRDAYISYGSNRYPVPWQLAGQEVWVREVSEQLEIGQGQKRVALHPLCRARHQVLTHPEYHRDIPLEDPRQRQKGKVQLRRGEPQVAVRSLAAYEAVVEGA